MKLFPNSRFEFLFFLFEGTKREIENLFCPYVTSSFQPPYILHFQHGPGLEFLWCRGLGPWGQLSGSGGTWGWFRTVGWSVRDGLWGRRGPGRVRVLCRFRIIQNHLVGVHFSRTKHLLLSKSQCALAPAVGHRSVSLMFFSALIFFSALYPPRVVYLSVSVPRHMRASCLCLTLSLVR